VLASLESWDNASEKLIETAISELSKKLGLNYQFLRLREYQCGKQKHKVATFKETKSGIEFQLIPGGRVPRELKMKEAKGTPIKPFLFGRFEVTKKDWVMVSKGVFTGISNANFPIAGTDLPTLLNWLKLTVDFRLPTIDEWLWAASGGANTAFPWGETIDLNYVWCSENSAGETRSVREHSDAVNGFGIADVFGNVWEWCEGHVIQGLSWADAPKVFRYSALTANDPNKLSTNVGLRVAITLPE
ncbi:MAG: SUMF1/EgtB/PvdO family nonheme iron enzyme, partial [Planctomycetota bacterium]|nr:SUMF1/EgtB/PvdO family nonheme iron enzyme [Planctomycetota bacterium]